MRGDIVYHVYGVHGGREKDSYFGAHQTRAAAEQQVAKLQAQEMNGRNWAEQYHDRGFVIREAVVDTDFESSVTVTVKSVRFGKSRAASKADRYDGITGPTVFPVRVRYSELRRWGKKR